MDVRTNCVNLSLPSPAPLRVPVPLMGPAGIVSSQPRLRSKLPGSWLRAPFRWPKVGRAHLAGACLARRALQLRANFSRLQVQPAPPASPRNPGGGGGIEASQPLPPSPSAPLPSSPLPARPSRPKRGRGELLSSARLRAPPRQPPTRPAEGLRSTAAQPLRPGASARAHTYTDTQHTHTHTHTPSSQGPPRDQVALEGGCYGPAWEIFQPVPRDSFL